MKKLRKQLLLLAALLALTLTGCEAQDLLSTERADSGSEVTAAYTMTESQITDQAPTAVSVLDVPEFSGEPYVVLNGNEPDFTDEEKTTESYEHYSDLDSLGRCGVAEANIGQDLMPTEKRGAIGQVKPTGWHTVKYDQVEGKYLYNRCHLIGYQLTGENANEKNLITGTRYLNVEGMLPFENMVADYVKETGNHVLYRVTPIFTGDNLVADGVEMEALSMEDDGEGISFHIFAYNNQPGISINYATGDSTLSESSGTMTDQQEYVMNTSSMKFHLPSCSSVSSIKDENKATYQGPREDLIAEGYEPCGTFRSFFLYSKEKHLESETGDGRGEAACGLLCKVQHRGGKSEGCAGKTGGGGGRGNPGKRMEACGCLRGEPLRYEPPVRGSRAEPV